MTQEGQSKVYKTQGATGLIVASGGTVNFNGGALDLTSGRVSMPANLARGYASLTPIGYKATATASGIVTAMTSGTTALVGLVNNGIATGAPAYRWSTNNGARLYFAPWRIPNDLSTASPLYVLYNAENVSGATYDCKVTVHGGGTATADLGTTGALSSTPIERSISVASGSIPATGLLAVAWAPTSGATSAVYLYAAGISYAKKTS